MDIPIRGLQRPLEHDLERGSARQHGIAQMAGGGGRQLREFCQRLAPTPEGAASMPSIIAQRRLSRMALLGIYRTRSRYRAAHDGIFPSMA